MNILAIDPGPAESAYVVWNGEAIEKADYVDNDSLLLTIMHTAYMYQLALEYPESRGMPVAQVVLDTAFWAGRFVAEHEAMLFKPREIRAHFCGTAVSTRANVRRAILDRYEMGTKRAQGPLYALKGHEPGVIGHLWDALAVGIVAADTLKREGE